MENKRNTSKEKKKRNKGFPYKSKIKKDKKNLLVFVFIVLIMFINLLSLIPQNIESKTISNITQQNILESCKNLNLENTAFCLKNNIKPFYKFKERNDNLKIPFSMLRDYGGDCKDWSEFYNDSLSKLGYNAEYIILQNDTFAHTHLITWEFNNNQTTYCSIDQLNINCYNIK